MEPSCSESTEAESFIMNYGIRVGNTNTTNPVFAAYKSLIVLKTEET